MSDNKENARIEAAIDAMLGPDDEMIDNELASELLVSYGIDENQLLPDLKKSIEDHLKELGEDSKKAKNLRNTLSSITAYQRAQSPDGLSAKEWVAKSVTDAEPPLKARVAYSFRNRKDGKIPERDKHILDNLEAELNNEDV